MEIKKIMSSLKEVNMVQLTVEMRSEIDLQTGSLQQIYRETGTSHNRNKGISVRAKTARTIENIETVREVLERNRRRNGAGISKTSLQRIVPRNLRWHPYKMTIRHQLNPDDNRRRIEFSSCFIERCRDHRFFF